MFMGEGASRVRELFNKAKAKCWCLLMRWMLWGGKGELALGEGMMRESKQLINLSISCLAHKVPKQCVWDMRSTFLWPQSFL